MDLPATGIGVKKEMQQTRRGQAIRQGAQPRFAFVLQPPRSYGRGGGSYPKLTMGFKFTRTLLMCFPQMPILDL